MHANDFGEQRHLAHPGVRVMFETQESDRGLKVASLTVLNEAGDATAEATPEPEPEPEPEPAGDSGCGVLSEAAYRAELTELLLRCAPSLTGEQVLVLREHLVRVAAGHGWVEA
ncbi:hypothetical protein Ahu01nite_089600 [Winogradskya humida]|uniref:Uncharacterized protein n=1 Tax=Winogradskya humida TaxID=113566 RepID=A0ABQ4A4V9_9ACTN|nr:hypothetical protein Ahu01nite_089600 [Actinoplanes humidus]